MYMASSTSKTRPFFHYFIILAALSSFFIASCDAQVKGCPFNAIYSIGVRDSSNSDKVSSSSLMVDQLAAAFHLPLPKVYTNQDGLLHHGASFATENFIALGKSFLQERGIEVPSDGFSDSLTAQLVSFANYLSPICFSHLECKQKLERAIFMVDLGSNDYKYAFLNGKSPEEVEAYVPSVFQIIGNLKWELIKAGASNILVPGMLPLGCIPGYVSSLHNVHPTDFDANNCHIGLNNLAKNYNDHVKQALSDPGDNGPYSQALSNSGDHPYGQILYADYYNAFMALLGENSNNPRALFQEDGFQPTEEANKYIVGKLLSGSNFVQPEIHYQDIRHCVM